jgi:hypothetical protein
MRLFIHLQNYPEWTIVNDDKYLYTQEEGDVLKNNTISKLKKRQTNPQINSSRRWAYIKVR